MDIISLLSVILSPLSVSLAAYRGLKVVEKEVHEENFLGLYVSDIKSYLAASVRASGVWLV